MHRRRFRSMVVVAGLAVLGTACGGDDDEDASSATTIAASTTAPGPAGSASAELCDAREALRASISELSDVDVVRNGTSAVTDAVDAIKEDLGAVRSAASTDVQPQVDAFEQALDDLQTALGSSSGAPPVSDIISGIGAVGTTGATLLTSLGNLQCS